MKYLVLGDIHGRECWKDIIPKENPDRIIFLGDYVSTHEDIDSGTQLENLHEILRAKEDWGDNMILLRGNHDMQHLGYSWAACSGHDRYVEIGMTKIKDDFLAATQWIYVDDDMVFSHAGISEVWMKNVGLDDVNKINDLEPSEKFGFWPCKFSDYSGISETQPPTWIRPWTLLDCAFGYYTYVVGHTPLGGYKMRQHIACLNDEIISQYTSSMQFISKDEQEKLIERMKTANRIWCCDALPYQYLIIEDGEFIAKDCNISKN